LSDFIAYRLFESDRRADIPDGSFVLLTENDLSPGEVLIKVAYSSINYKDALAAAGINKIIRSFPRIGGIDLSGHVMTSSDSRFKAGDAVVVHGFGIGVECDGGHSQVARVAADSVMLLPPGIDVFEAAVIGAAGYTAALSLHWMEHNGLTPGTGPVLVSGATGGVAGVAIDILAGRGYEVTAMTGKETAEQYLRELGARHVMVEREVVKNSKLIESARWTGAVDSLGGDALAWILKTCMPDAVVASFGNAAGSSYEASVLPFILRGVRLLGINANSSMELRRVVWGKLAQEYRPRHLASIAHMIEFDQLPDFMARMRARTTRGRTLIRMPS
jgi:acrylyl-CoA reductase (NADPH)